MTLLCPAPPTELRCAELRDLRVGALREVAKWRQLTVLRVMHAHQKATEKLLSLIAHSSQRRYDPPFFLMCLRHRLHQLLSLHRYLQREHVALEQATLRSPTWILCLCHVMRPPCPASPACAWSRC